MKKEELLKHYIEIENSAHSKKVKQRLITEFTDSLKSTSFPFEDIEYISSRLFKTDTTIHLDFFSTILYPIIQEEIESKNIRAIELLLQFNPSLIQYIDKKYSSYELIKKGLSIDSDNIKLLTIFKTDTENHIKYSIHEIPAGVLYNSDAATIEQCDELLEYLEKYKSVCAKLNMDESDLIHNANFYYSSYKKYLLNKDAFEDFEHYLKDNWAKSKE